MMNFPVLPANKIVVIGIGWVGAALAHALTLKAWCRELVLIDVAKDWAEGHARDLRHAALPSDGVAVRAGDYGDAAGAEIVVICAGAKREAGGTRLDLLERNAAVFDSIIPELKKYAPDAVLMTATNPVDVLTWYTVQKHGWDSAKTIGTGTLLDTNRLRVNLAAHLQCETRAVRSLVIGEHGDSMVPVWSRCGVAAFDVDQYCRNSNVEWNDDVRAAIAETTRTDAYKITSLKEASAYGITTAMLQVIEIMVTGMRDVYPLSIALSGGFGLDGVAISVPTNFSREGVHGVMEMPLDESEITALHKSAEVLKSHQSKLTI